MGIIRQVYTASKPQGDLIVGNKNKGQISHMLRHERHVTNAFMKGRRLKSVILTLVLKIACKIPLSNKCKEREGQLEKSFEVENPGEKKRRGMLKL